MQSKLINLVNEDDENIVTVFVGLRQRVDVDVYFSFLNSNVHNQDGMEPVDFNILDGKAILIPD